MECNICYEKMIKIDEDEWFCPECGNRAFVDIHDQVFYELEDYEYEYIYLGSDEY